MGFSILSYLFLVFLGFFVFYTFYLFVLFGLKTFKIENVSKKKVIVYLLSTLIRVIILIYAGKFIDFTNNFIYFGSSLINFFLDVLLFRYYFLITGKKLWQFFLYFVSIPLIFDVIIRLPLFIADYSRFLGSILSLLFLILFIYFVFWLRKKV